MRRRVRRGRHVVRRVILKTCGHSITLDRQRVLVVVPARHPTMLTAPARQPRIELRLQWFIRETFGHKDSLRLALYCTTQSAGLQAPPASPAARLTNPGSGGAVPRNLPGPMPSMFGADHETSNPSTAMSTASTSQRPRVTQNA